LTAFTSNLHLVTEGIPLMTHRISYVDPVVLRPPGTDPRPRSTPRLNVTRYQKPLELLQVILSGQRQRLIDKMVTDHLRRD
jgi:hypothetical protein